MKKYFVLCLICFFLGVHPNLHAQNYTWKKGANSINQNGAYGTQGVAAPANNPGARDGAVSWKDAAGNFWLFGGFGLDATGYNQLNDLWKYNPSTNQWTFMKGNTTGGQSGVYGTMGVAASGNKPGSRSKGVSWTDAAGNLWMFGGNGYDAAAQQGYLNDLWKYDPSSNNWTWVKGSNLITQAGIYGTQGVAANGNVPGSREGAVSWSDALGNLWMFSGYGLEATANVGQLNDLWKYNIANNQWTWVKGSNSYDQNGTYGTLGTGAAANTPGGRRYGTAWTDVSGTFWLLGGYGYPATGALTGHLNDLWKYDAVSNQWTWVKGSNVYDQLGVYGAQGTPAPGNYPGGRVAGMAWTDAGGDLWLMGGYGYGISIPTFDYMNDLWKYSINSNQWTWIKGGNTISQAGVYGTQGIPSPLNTPGGRCNSVGWYDAMSGLWLFGGSGYDTNSQTSSGFLNDLWKFGSCNSQSISVAATPTAICSGASATLNASGAGLYSWSNAATGSSIVVAPPSTTTYVVHSADPNNCGDSAVIQITVFPLPAISASSSNSLACVGNTVTITATGAQTYTWSSGQSGSNITAVATNTIYTVTGSSSAGCTASASVTQSVMNCVGIAEGSDNVYFRISPNPSKGEFILELDGNRKAASLSIHGIMGQLLFKQEIVDDAHRIHPGLTPGVYFLTLESEGVSPVTKKLVIE